MRNNRIRLTEPQLHRVIKESVMNVLYEEKKFTPHGFKTRSNFGGNEIEISPSGDAARFRIFGGEPTEWLEIQFDEDGVAYVETDEGIEKLSDYMRI